MVEELRDIMLGKRGSAGILAVIVMMLLGVLGAGLVSLSSTEVNTSANFRDGITAQYMAEAGAMWATSQLDTARGNNSDMIAQTNSASGKSYPSATRPYTVLIKRDPNDSANSDKRQIISTATVNGASRQVVMTVTLASAGASADPVLSHSGFAGKSLTITSGTVITGDMGANTTATQWGGAINGNIDSCSSFIGTYSGTGTVTTTSKNLDLSNLAKLPAAPVSYSMNGTGKTSLNSSIYSGSGYNNMSGTYYVSGNLGTGSTTFTAQSGNTAIIYVNGDVSLNSGTVFNGNVTIIANGSVSLNGASITASGGTINFYAKKDFNYNSGSSISAKDVTIMAGIAGMGGTAAGGSVQLNNNTPITASGTAQIFAQNNFSLNSNAQIIGNALVKAGSEVDLNQGTALNTMFVSGGDAQVNSGANVGQVYAASNLYVYGGRITYDATLAQGLGLGGVATSFWVNSINNHQ